MDLSIIIVSYNVKFYLEQALRSILEAVQEIEAEIIVVDNGSGDGSVQLLRERFPGVICIANPENRGFARANNQAIALAQGEAVCLINPDTLVREDTFKQCIQYLKEHPRTGIVGCKILNPDGSLQLSCRRSYPTPWVAFSKISGLSTLFPKSRIFGRYNLTYLDPDETTEVEAISGSFMMVRRKTIEEVGGLDERFFMYGEDLDWCYRIHKNGWKVIYLPSTQIIHYKGMSTREATFDHLKMFYGAMRLFVKKHFNTGWTLFPQWLLLAGIWMRGALSLLMTGLRRISTALADLVLLQAAMALAILIRFGNFQHWQDYGIVNVVYTLVWLCCGYAVRLYRRGVYSSSKAVGAVMLGLVINTSLTFFFPQYAFSRQVVLAAGLFAALFLGGWRLLIRFASRMRQLPFLGTIGRTLLKRRVLIVGTGKAGLSILNRLKKQIDAGYEVVGFLATRNEDLLKEVDDSVEVLGTINELGRIARSHHVREVIFTPDDASYRTILSVIAEGTDLHLDYKMVPRELDVIIGKSSIDPLETLPLVDLDYRLFSGPNRVVKRGFDLIAGICLLPAALIIRLISLSRGNKRSKIQIDNGFGKTTTLRALKKHIDNPFTLYLLPEVIFGKLSLVGSKMTQPSSGSGRGYKPGLTGLVQIQQNQNMNYEESQRFDLYYLKNHSLILDLEILFKALFHT